MHRDMNDREKERMAIIQKDIAAGDALRTQALIQASMIDSHSSINNQLVQFIQQQNNFWIQASEKVQEIQSIKM